MSAAMRIFALAPGLALALALTLAGCSPDTPSALPPPPAPGALDACCVNTPQMPAGIVAFADDHSAKLLPWMRGTDLRRPRLVAHPEALREVADLAEPLDVLAVSMKFTLAGRMNRGVMTHALVYLGSEAELRRAGLWSHPALRPWHAAIRGGARFVEAIDPAVRLAPPEIALRVDSVAILRPELGASARRRALKVLADAIGKGFDSRFRLDDDVSLYCTELVTLAMPGLHLPERILYGRVVILPDDLALMAVKGEGLRLVAYLRGRRGGWDLLGAEALAADLAQAWAPVPAVEPGD